jgi:hypothetical protein
VSTLLDEYAPLVEAISAEGGRKFNRYGAEQQDFAQELFLWVYQNEEWLHAKREEIGDDEQFTRFLAKCLRGEILDYGLDIRAQAGGQDRASAYWYTRGEVAVLLDSVFDREAWLNPPQSDGKSVSDPALGNNWLATLADVARGFDLLDTEDQMLLRRFHEDGERNIDMAMESEVSEATMSYRHNRALNRLLDKLGGEKPRHMRPDDRYDPWRGRRAITNSTARHITSNNYEE